MQTRRLGVVFFHKNIKNIYSQRWIDKCVTTMLLQTVNDFHIYEVNYGNDDYSVIEQYELPNSVFYKTALNDHAEAMNFVITKAFEDGCDYVFNTNLDDYYSEDRIEVQLKSLLAGNGIVASNFSHVRDFGDGLDRV